MAHEEWRDVVGYEGYYQVSNLGRVRSLDRMVGGPFGSKRISKGRILKPQKQVNGYLFVVLSVHGKHSQRLIHRLVAEAFLSDWNQDLVVDHINFDRTDNRVENLRMLTQLENIRHSIESGNFDIDAKTRIVTSPETREANLKVLSRPVIRNDGVRFESMSAAARAIGCSKQAIQFVLKGINNSAKGYGFRYAD